MLRKFSCVKECSDCCIYREYYPSIEYGKIGVLIMPEERSRIRAIAARNHINVKIIPRLGIGMNVKGDGPKEIIAYQMMGKNLNGNYCPFLETNGFQRSPNDGLMCKIYDQRPLACVAYPVIEENGKSLLLDGKCTFCNKFSTTLIEKDGTQQEIEALTKIKSEVNVDEKIEIWRYATAIGDKENAARFFPAGWILQKDSQD
jgi:Fe-S-cluster containining protein